MIGLPALFGLGSLATNAIAVAVILGGLTAAWYGVKTHYVKQGREACRAEIAELNEQAKARGREGMQQRAACTDSGGTWNSALGECVRSR